jgi:hypothetical protein
VRCGSAAPTSLGNRSLAEDIPPETFDAADPVAVNNAKREEARQAREDADVYRTIMHSKQGRAWLYRRLAECHIFGETFVPGQHDVTCFRLGEENFGRRIMMAAQDASIDLYTKMIKEQQDEAKRLDEMRRGDQRRREAEEKPPTAEQMLTVQDTTAAANAVAAAAPATADGAAAAATADARGDIPQSTPSLLEAADGKPKKEEATDAKASDAKTDDAAAKDAPVPADAAKADDVKDAKADGEKKPEAKADEAKKDDAAKATDPANEASAEAQPPAPVKYEAFKVPEGVKLDDKELAKFTDIVGSAQVKQEDAQKLVDLYVAERQRDVEAIRQEQRRVWDALNDTWKSELRKDQVLGGNRLETSLSMAKAVIEEYGGSPEQVRELLAHTTNNGMGNYAGFVRLLHNIGQALNIFEDGIVPANPKPPKPVKGPGQRGWYNNSNMGDGAAKP